MDVTKARQKIRERLESKSLPKDFDLTSFTVGSPPKNTKCAGCHELFSLSNTRAVAHRRSGKFYWFHEDCEKLWQEERQAWLRSINHLVRPQQH